MNKHLSGPEVYHEHLARKMQEPDFAEAYAQAKIEAQFACEIGMAREARGLTQAQLAAKLHCKQQMVSRYEKGQIPDLPMLQKLAAALEIAITIDKTGRLNFASDET